MRAKRKQCTRHLTDLDVAPVWCAQQGRREQGIAILKRLNGSIEGYSAEKQYDILVRSIEYEKKQNSAIRKEHWWNIFLGTNLVRSRRIPHNLATHLVLWIFLVATRHQCLDYPRLPAPWTWAVPYLWIDFLQSRGCR